MLLPSCACLTLTHPPTHAHANATTPTPTTSQVHTTAPTPAPATAQALSHATTPAPPARGSTFVTHKCLIPLDIRPSHALPLCACVTPIHLWSCVAGSTNVTCKMSIPPRWSPFMDDLGIHSPLLYIKAG
ncbi:hypothetical protein O181_008824 [Austropuccinia psidii MF-1]|uniref:Uncharacterized protein n=1 Tax=Austropuccinia psidii MF-1 TaxID=1389203 RepID=A0A9Q3BN69_9BASI|nr:hypothetical protein [Austropuccinia psidii MF-1]